MLMRILLSAFWDFNDCPLSRRMRREMGKALCWWRLTGRLEPTARLSWLVSQHAARSGLRVV